MKLRQYGDESVATGTKLNVGPSAIGMYEQRHRTPAIVMLIQMASLFGVSLDYLVTGTETLTAPTDGAMQRTCLCRIRCFYCNKLELS